MKTLCLLLSLFTFTSSTCSANLFSVDESLSTVGFSSIKLQYVVEPAVIKKVTGNLDANGVFVFRLPLSELNTGIPIRNERLNALFFDSKSFPQILVKGKVDMDILNADEAFLQRNIPFSVEIFGNKHNEEALVNIVKINNNIAISSAKPVIISAANYGIPATHLHKLAETVGRIAISNTVPVSFSIVLNKSLRRGIDL
ncbi:YceI family protein [Photobacterium leiognathi]|uniref:YceI family protein n=1 Tax=Photobacterium leiognathi TaxID=553611 RepID=UPI00273909CE|nr:YceI family protein [Photobacterium leiognathi]